MATALDETACDTDGLVLLALLLRNWRKVYAYRALASNHDPGRVQGIRLLQDLKGLDTSADSDGRALVIAGTAELVSELDVLETVRVDDQGAPADTAA